MPAKPLRWTALSIVLLGFGQIIWPARPTAQAARLVDVSSARPQASFREVAISPDGHRVAYVQNFPGSSGIFVVDRRAAQAGPVRLNAAEGVILHSEQALAWSPDSQWLAFLSDQEKAGQMQLYLARATGGPARKLTALSGLLAAPRWSPDGRQIAFLYTENPSKAAGPTSPNAVQTGIISDNADCQALSSIDLATGQARRISPRGLYVYEYDWSPTSKECVLIAASPPGDNHWYIAQVHRLHMATGELKSVCDPKMQIAMPRWSPNGQWIAFIGGLLSDEGVIGGDVYVLPAEGGAPRNLTPDSKTSASWLHWHPTSKEILFAEFVDGKSGLARVSLDGSVNHLWKGSEGIAADGELTASITRDQQTLALIRQSFQSPPEVWAGPIGDWRPLTQVNQNVLPAWGEAKSLRWKSDQYEVQGWLLYPQQYDPAQKYPLVVQVHGGPAWAFTPRWLDPESLDAQLSRRGYFVFMPNPRGSFGKGEAFTRANVKDFGHGDFHDIMTGLDEILRTLPVDKDRLHLTGGSYGGYMTMWGVTQTERFRTAVAFAGICNWQSYYGQNGIEQWMLPYFGATVYDNPAVYARSSPITFIKRVKTPTLILVGERDLECPVPQSLEFYYALKTLKVPTQLVIYPGEGHGVRKREHVKDVVQRTLAWFESGGKGPVLPFPSGKE